MKLTPTYKLVITGVGFVLMLLLSYQLAIKNTLVLKRSYKELQEKARSADDLPWQIAQYTRQLEAVNREYFSSANSLDAAHELFLERLGYIASGQSVVIMEYPPEHKYTSSRVEVETHSAVLKGKFLPLLKVLHALEVKERVGRLVSVRFFTETNRRTKETALYMQVYIQNFKNSTRGTE